MEGQRIISLNGQELTAEDTNAVSKLGSLTQDYVFAELFRLPPFTTSSGTVIKAVLPYGYGRSNGSDLEAAGIVVATGVSAPTLLVLPFRAFVGTRSDVPDVSALEKWREIRSTVVADRNSGGGFSLPVSLAATVANNRCDLVYAHYTISAVNETAPRYVRDPATDVLTQPSVTVETADKVEILVAQGTEASTPTRPSLPADSGSDYYIPLAYVYLAHPNAGVASKLFIHEVAPVISLHSTTGAASLSPVDAQNDPAGGMLTATPFSASGTPHRPETYVPPTMCGQVSKFMIFRWDGTPKSPAVNSTVTLDTSVDWRNRIFFWTAQVTKNSGAGHVAWAATSGQTTLPTAFPIGGLGACSQFGFGQSFLADLGSLGPGTGMGVAVLTPTNMSQLASNVVIFVDGSTGALKLITSADPGANVIIKIDATGPYANA